MIFKQVFDEKSSTYTYLIASSKGREALIIDPVIENVGEYIKLLKELDLKMPISLEKIKKNYKKLVKIFHPDVNGNNKDAEEKFKQINESYKLLLKKFMKKND